MNIKDIIIKRVDEEKKESVKRTFDFDCEQFEKFKENCSLINKKQVSVINALMAEFNDSCKKKKKA